MRLSTAGSNTDHLYAIQVPTKNRSRSSGRPLISTIQLVDRWAAFVHARHGCQRFEGIACQPTVCPTSRLCRTLTEPRLGVPSRMAVRILSAPAKLGESHAVKHVGRAILNVVPGNETAHTVSDDVYLEPGIGV